MFSTRLPCGLVSVPDQGPYEDWKKVEMMTDEQHHIENIKRFQRIESRLDEVQAQLHTIGEMVSVGKGAFIAAKVLGWVTATGVAVIELWRMLRSH
jgi:hypothetical protein